MSDESDSFNTDIFLKSPKKGISDMNISSSLFTESTPSKFYDVTDSAFITKDLMHIHKKLLDSDLIPSHSESTNYSQYSQYGAGKNSIGDSTGMSTMELPINYSESSDTNTSALKSAMEYAYKEVIPYANFSGTSSSESESSSSSSSSLPKPKPKRKVSRTTKQKAKAKPKKKSTKSKK